jgi:hypothetical protein
MPQRRTQFCGLILESKTGLILESAPVGISNTSIRYF